MEKKLDEEGKSRDFPPKKCPPAETSRQKNKKPITEKFPTLSNGNCRLSWDDTSGGGQIKFRVTGRWNIYDCLVVTFNEVVTLQEEQKRNSLFAD
jgi:hypothetical protein